MENAAPQVALPPGYVLQCGHGHEAVENPPRRATTRPPPSCFNAATAMRPWRTGAGSPPPRRPSHGFNAATAMRPWRTESIFIDFQQPFVSFNAATAMRPWRTGGGTPSTPSRCTLQCGHGHEAVENASCGVTTYWCSVLQCGHGHEAVENGGRLTEVAADGSASMRPRP